MSSIERILGIRRFSLVGHHRLHRWQELAGLRVRLGLRVRVRAADHGGCISCFLGAFCTGVHKLPCLKASGPMVPFELHIGGHSIPGQQLLPGVDPSTLTTGGLKALLGQKLHVPPRNIVVKLGGWRPLSTDEPVQGLYRLAAETIDPDTRLFDAPKVIFDVDAGRLFYRQGERAASLELSDGEGLGANFVLDKLVFHIDVSIDQHLECAKVEILNMKFGSAWVTKQPNKCTHPCLTGRSSQALPLFPLNILQLTPRSFIFLEATHTLTSWYRADPRSWRSRNTWV